METARYPDPVEPDLVGSYSPLAKAGGGFVAPLERIGQLEYLDEPAPGEYRHVKELRVAEWPVQFLRRPRRAPHTIPDFLSPTAPPNRLDILRGLARVDSPQE